MSTAVMRGRGGSVAWDIFKTIAWIVGPLSLAVFIALFGRLPAFRYVERGIDFCC